MIPSVFTIALFFLVAIASTHGFTVFQPHYNSLQLKTTPSSVLLWSSPSDGADDYDSPSDISDDDSLETEEFEDGPGKSELLSAIDSAAGYDDSKVVFGFGDSSSNIPELAKALEKTYVLPLDKPSEWKLLYTNAPDLLGLEGGPISQLVSLEQKWTTSELSLVLTYKPSEGILQQIAGNFLDDLPDDRLTQEVVFDYEEKPMNAFDLKLQSTSIDSTRFGSLPTLSIPGAAPFVEAIKMVFNDGDLRMERTVQGDFLVIYKRTD